MIKDVNGLFRLEYMAFCMSQMPPQEVGSSLEDYVRFAKFQLSLDKHLLMEDPIWDRYTDEQILIEYMAGMFMKNPEKLKEFETKLTGQDSDVYDWLDRKIEENKKEMAEQLDKMEENVSFSPESLGE
jgi:hypothetical protein